MVVTEKFSLLNVPFKYFFLNSAFCRFLILPFLFVKLLSCNFEHSFYGRYLVGSAYHIFAYTNPSRIKPFKFFLFCWLTVKFWAQTLHRSSRFLFFLKIAFLKKFQRFPGLLGKQNSFQTNAEDENLQLFRLFLANWFNYFRGPFHWIWSNLSE